jgi:hypothetical protein
MADIIIAKTVTQSNALNDLMHENATKVVGVQQSPNKTNGLPTQFKSSMAFQAQPNSSQWRISSLHHHTHYKAMFQMI